MAGQPVPYATAEGALYELVSRGKKDVYFYEDKDTSVYPFDNTYEPQAPHSFEIRRVPPHTACDFGRTIQFDFDLVGDVLKDPTLVIKLPTWLPPAQAATNNTSVISDSSGVTYGYTNGIAYFLFDQIQFFQDNILIQEFSGDALWAMDSNRGTFSQSHMISKLAGQHDNTSLNIAHNVVPGELRLQIPIIGCQRPSDPGFPQRSCVSHSSRLRCRLRKLEDLVEASDGRAKPQPWERSDFQQIPAKNASPIPFTTLTRSQILPPDIRLETKQVYMLREYQDELQTKPQKITFLRPRETIFTQNQLNYASVVSGGVAVIKRLLEGRHPAERVTWFFRSVKDINANRLWKIDTGTAGQESYYNTVGLQIAGRDRELSRSSAIWRDVTNFAKEEIDSQSQINTMNWGLGAIVSKRFPGHDAQPTGNVNFTTSDRPTFYINLAPAPIDPYTGSPNTELRVIEEGWARFDTDGRGRAELFSQN